MKNIKEIMDKLKKNEIFNDVEDYKVEKIISELRHISKTYSKDQIIANEGDICTGVGLIVDGVIEIQKIYSSGKHIVVKRMEEGEVFGEAIMYSEDNEYPATIIAASDCRISYINKEDIIKLCLNEEIILRNFIILLSNKIFVLNRKIKTISFKSIRQKVINFILEQVKSQKTTEIKLKLTKEQISSLLGIPRPSLSRELMKLRDDGIIEFDRSNIKVIRIEDLEEELLE
ncbi:Crp/Fnr family transcriptional regulator [uncultured Clostridium sp.]|uniref:Crp/Fnr family transcriptional regulator n=1 Tax=uncultured Clostridium sp. TaxID=59620 RepID=UPI0025EFFE98|nr:Crp/Fnr family transcriptional regulator [uncultured Clostridium sp.]